MCGNNIVSSHYDTVCIGAGPANLALAEVLVRGGQRVLVLDLGLTPTARHCPLAAGKNCPPCKTCHAVHGISGAGAYSDGKLSFFPAGSGLLELAGGDSRLQVLDERLREYFSPLLNLPGEFTTCADAQSLRAAASKQGIELKPYDVYHGGSEAIQEFYSQKYEELLGAGVHFQSRSKVSEINHVGGVFRVEWESSGQRKIAFGSNVSLGVGKACGSWLRHTLDHLRVERIPTSIEVGVRIEFPFEIASHIAGCHRDAKFKAQCADGSEMRSFCFCHRGFVLGAYYDDMTTVSGFSLRERESVNTNFAILNRVDLQVQNPYAVVLPHIQAQNKSANGGITVQTLEDFRNDVPTTDDGMKCNTVRPTLSSAMPGCIYTNFIPMLKENVLGFIDYLDAIAPGIGAGSSLLYGPVLEKSWDKVVLSGMTTSTPGVFVVGDATGHVRGVVQAAGTGLLAAAEILGKCVSTICA